MQVSVAGVENNGNNLDRKEIETAKIQEDKKDKIDGDLQKFDEKLPSPINCTIVELPKSEFWTPYLHDEFPPKSRKCINQPPEFVPRKVSQLKNNILKNPDNLIDMKAAITIGPRLPVVLKDKNKIKSNSIIPPKLLQTQTPASTKQTTVKNEDDIKSWQFQYQPMSDDMADNINSDEIGSFEELSKLLDGANIIYCMDSGFLFGVMRCAPTDIVDLSHFKWAPHTLINDPEIMEKQNPFRPKQTDPYSSLCQQQYHSRHQHVNKLKVLLDHPNNYHQTQIGSKYQIQTPPLQKPTTLTIMRTNLVTVV